MIAAPHEGGDEIPRLSDRVPHLQLDIGGADGFANRCAPQIPAPLPLAYISTVQRLAHDPLSTAVASISTLAESSTRARTSTSVIAG